MQVAKQKIVVLGTGGTIAGESAHASERLVYTSAQRSIDQLLACLPNSPAALQAHELVSEQVAQLDSKDMDFATWMALAQRCHFWLQQSEVKAVVITHGTDTLEETAYFLSRVLPGNKPVVMTCAMLPANAVGADGPQNLQDALTLALSPDPRAQGVLLVCAGQIHTALHVQKIHPTRLDAFGSLGRGPLGLVGEGVVQWLAQTPQPANNGHAESSVKAQSGVVSRMLNWPPAQTWPWVEIISNHVGANGAVVKAMVQAGAYGVVVAGTGNGSLSQALSQALEEAQSAGLQVCLATRCATGSVMPLPGAKFADSKGLSPVKARVSMLLDWAEQRSLN
ncbi:MAG: asparaginase [Limnohabitans sp.]|jgi:L-asparaginase|nr:asparaginase [Burkholderiales bacterium]